MLPVTQRAELPLPGGTANAGRVVRVDDAVLGDTVRRPMRATSPASHALLRWLERVGFDGAPRLLGIDEQRREVLRYVHGSSPSPPYPAWAYTDEALVSVAELLRRFHDAVEGFDPGRRPWPRGASPDFRDRGFVSHNDVHPGNVVFRDGRAITLLDFDLAAPGCREWDLAIAAREWVPLGEPSDAGADAATTAEWAGSADWAGSAAARLRLLADAYGLAPAQRRRLADALVPSWRRGYELVAASARQGHPEFARRWRGGGHEREHRTGAWLARHDAVLRRALR